MARPSTQKAKSEAVWLLSETFELLEMGVSTLGAWERAALINALSALQTSMPIHSFQAAKVA